MKLVAALCAFIGIVQFFFSHSLFGVVWIASLLLLAAVVAFVARPQPASDPLYKLFIGYGRVSDAWYDDTPASNPRILLAIDSPVGRFDDPYLQSTAAQLGCHFALFKTSMVLVAGLPAAERAIWARDSSLYVERNGRGQARLLYARKPTLGERIAHMAGSGLKRGG